MMGSVSTADSLIAVGEFQTIEFPTPDAVLIRDKLYGEHLIHEPALVELLRSKALDRLRHVCQYGITGILGQTPFVTRFEHSVGAFLLVRKVGAGLDEQIAALLHDISHTALSHVIDWILTKPGESYHEVHKDRYVQSTDLPNILARHGFGDLKPLHEELYPLVEKDSPHLCADRLDYALRDSTAFGILTASDARRVFDNVRAHPDSSSPSRILILDDQDLALTLARAYLASDRDVWSNPKHVDVGFRTAGLIGEMLREKRLFEDQLWELSDRQLWGQLLDKADGAGLQDLRRLETEGLREDSSRIPKGTKIRTLDPDVCVPGVHSSPTPLSVACPEWGEERRAYIEARSKIMV